jgi:hypothetical protein
MPSSQLTSVQVKRYYQLKIELRKRVKSTAEFLAYALEMKQDRLYLEEYDTFEEFSREELGLTPQYVRTLLKAAPVLAQHPEIKSVSAAAQVAKVPEPERQEVITEALNTGTGSVTAEAVKKALPPPPKRPATPPAPPKPEKGPIDGTGLEVPVESRALWNRRQDALNLINSISDVRSFLKRCQDSKDPLFVEVDYTDDLANLNQVYVDLKRAIPYAVCPTCQGKQPATCTTCKGRGFVSQFYWDNCVPQEVKDLRK